MSREESTNQCDLIAILNSRTTEINYSSIFTERSFADESNEEAKMNCQSARATLCHA